MLKISAAKIKEFKFSILRLFQSLKIILKSIVLNLVYTSVPSKLSSRDFPGGLVVKTPCIHCRVHGFGP